MTLTTATHAKRPSAALQVATRPERPNKTLQRIGGVAAIASGSLGILAAPFNGAAYLATEAGGEAAIPWDGPFRDAVPGAFSFASVHDVYVTYIQVFSFVWAGLIVGLVALHDRQRTALGRGGGWAYRLLLVAMGLALVGILGEAYTPYLEEFFLLSGPGILLTVAFSVWYGILTLRARVLPRGAACLLAFGPLFLFPGIALFGHIAIGLMFLDAAWIWLGATLARSGTSQANGTAR